MHDLIFASMDDSELGVVTAFAERVLARLEDAQKEGGVRATTV